MVRSSLLAVAAVAVTLSASPRSSAASQSFSGFDEGLALKPEVSLQPISSDLEVTALHSSTRESEQLAQEQTGALYSILKDPSSLGRPLAAHIDSPAPTGTADAHNAAAGSGSGEPARRGPDPSLLCSHHPVLSSSELDLVGQYDRFDVSIDLFTPSLRGLSETGLLSSSPGLQSAGDSLFKNGSLRLFPGPRDLDLRNLDKTARFPSGSAPGETQGSGEPASRGLMTRISRTIMTWCGLRQSGQC